jgi:hypothetical protein
MPLQPIPLDGMRTPAEIQAIKREHCWQCPLWKWIGVPARRNRGCTKHRICERFDRTASMFRVGRCPEKKWGWQ